MSTRSIIATVNKDDKIESIYCHFDGYPDGVGYVLRRYYNNDFMIGCLMELGNISTLDEFCIPVGNTHSFDTPEIGVSVAYGRDRGESGQESKIWDSIQDWLGGTQKDNSFIDYAYLWDGEEWCGWNCFTQEPVDWSKYE